MKKSGNKDFSKIKNIIKENEQLFRNKYKINSLGIFGSYVRGEAKKSSDIDILISFQSDNPISLFDFIEFEDYLKDLLQKKVDLVTKNSLKEELKPYILDEVQFLWKE